MADLDDGITSDSSASSDDSFRRKNKNIAKNPDTQPEEISDGKKVYAFIFFVLSLLCNR